MPVSRLDLADAGSPEKLVALILKAEPDLPVAVPIEQLCRQLDITEIQPLQTEGFEGGLITDTDRSSGIILVNQASPPTRRRFTIAHELAHFLIPTHIPDAASRFLCSRADMMRLTAKETDRRARMEVEANRFASLILIPPPMFRQAIARHTAHCEIGRGLQGEQGGHGRAYAERHHEILAVVAVHNGHVLRSYRDRTRFPFIQPSAGAPVPRGSLYHRGKHEWGAPGDFAEATPDDWIDMKRGERAPALYEQVYVQQQGYALILLHLIKPDEDEEEERDLEQSWEPRFRR